MTTSGLITQDIIALPNGPSASANAMASLEFDVVDQDVVQVDVTNGMPGQTLSRIESLYVDNTRGAGALLVVFNDTARVLIVPQGAEGCYPTYSASTYFRVAQHGSKKGVHARMKAFACLKMYYERFPGAQGLLQNPLDVDNGPNGKAPPPSGPSGWDTSYAGPNVVIAGNRITFPNGGPIMVPWKSARDVADGVLYFEITNETTGNTGPGLANSSEPYLHSPPNRMYVGTQNKSVNMYQNYLQNSLTRLLESGPSAQNKTLGFLVDFPNRGINVTVNGTSLAVSPGQGGSKPGEATIALLATPLQPIAMIDNTDYQAPGASFLMTSVPPFLYPPAALTLASPWDDPGGPMV